MSRFVPRKQGVKFYFAPAVAVLAAPTRTEITAAVDLTPQLADTSGFSAAPQSAEVPDYDSDFTKKVPGIKAAEDPTMTFWEDDDSSTIRTAVADGAAGFIIRCPYGDVAAKRCEVWPVRSTGPNTNLPNDNNAAQFVVVFATEDAPELEAVLPA